MSDQPGPTDPPDNSFDAAFEGAAWGSSRRRRRSSSRPSDPNEPADDRPDSDRPGDDRPADDPPATDRTAAGPVTAGRPASSSSRRSGSRSGTGGSGRTTRRVRAVVTHVLLGVLGLAVAWVVVTGLLAGYQLSEARGELTSLQGSLVGQGSDPSAVADSFAAHAHHAAVLTRGPAWATLAAIPGVGTPFETIRGITTQTSSLADDIVPGLLGAASQIDPRTVVDNGAVDLAAVQRASAPVHEAATRLAGATRAVDALPHSTWLPFVDSARADVASSLDRLDGTLTPADEALRVLPTMLGGDGRTRRYFVAFQNNAELRGTGGLPGAFAIVSALDGKIAIERFESDTLLIGVPSGQEFGAAYDQQYSGSDPYTQYVDSNVSPNFPYAAQIWLGMWKNATGEQLDGAMTVDPGALSYLLAATGPTKAPDGTQVTSDNVVSLLQQQAYAKFPDASEDNAARRAYILGIAEAVERKVIGSNRSGRGLLLALGRSVSERRIVVWSADSTVEPVLAGAIIGGVVPQTSEPFSMLSINNGAAGKLDYYLARSVHVERSGCGDTRDVTVTITLTNQAPASGLPAYVTARRDDPPYPTVPGQNRAVADYLATDGAALRSSTLDGEDAGAGVFDEQGHPVFRLAIELLPGQTRTWVLHLLEPAGQPDGNAPVTVLKQPGVQPVQVTVDDASCG